jgi:hypothetical protein
MLIAVVGAFVSKLCSADKPTGALWSVAIAISVVLFFGSRDALKKYYDRANAILSESK